MADFNKVGLLVLNEDKTEFLVCEKGSDDMTTDFIMPGGQIEEGESDEECLQREIQEELSCDIAMDTLRHVDEYQAPAAGAPDKIVSIKLYVGKLIGTPTPSNEVQKLHWISKEDQVNIMVSEIIRNEIIPDLMVKDLLS